MFLKIALVLSALLLVEAAEITLPKKEILLKTFHSDFFDGVPVAPDADTNLEGSAVVLKSNLPAQIQSRLASALTAIYQSTSDKLQRAQQFQTTTARIQYYILLQIDGDRVLAFGLN